MKIRLLLACLLASLSTSTVLAAAGDASIAITVPMNLSQINPAVRNYGAQCFVVDNTNGARSPANAPFGNSPYYPIQHGQANGQAVVNVIVPANFVMQAKGYYCIALLHADSGTAGAFTNPSGVGPYWAVVSPQSTVTVSGSLQKGF